MVLLVLTLILTTAGACGWLGYQWAMDKTRVERVQLAQERSVLEAEWQALDQAQRIRDVFLDARRAMQAEAQRHTNRTER